MLRLTLLGSLVLILTVAPLTAADNPSTPTNWPQWRGPKRDDLSTDTGLLKAWPAGGPRLLWEGKGAGRGYASLAITGGRIYTLGDGPSTASDKDEYVTCFDEANGKQLWKTKVGPTWDSQQNQNRDGSRSTPTVDGDRVYVVTPYGKLVCLQSADGKELWQKDFKKDFGGAKGDGWGYSESVLIDGDKVVCTPGGKTTMTALNKKTGEPIWKATMDKDWRAGHSSIVPAQVGNTLVYVQTTAGGVVGVRANDGKVLWNYPIERTTAVIPTPIIQGDLVFFAAGYGRGGALLRQVPAGDGVKVEEVFPLKKELTNKHGGVVHVGEFLYGDTDSQGMPWCAEFMTGKVRWKKRGSGRGSAAITYADGNLYVRYDNGTMVLAKASPEDYKEISSFKVPHSGDRPSWSHPVVAGGKLFLREGDYILCYDLRAK